VDDPRRLDGQRDVSSRDTCQMPNKPEQTPKREISNALAPYIGKPSRWYRIRSTRFAKRQTERHRVFSTPTGYFDLESAASSVPMATAQSGFVKKRAAVGRSNPNAILSRRSSSDGATNREPQLTIRSEPVFKIRFLPGSLATLARGLIIGVLFHVCPG